jgi:hypothetical protein
MQTWDIVYALKKELSDYELVEVIKGLLKTSSEDVVLESLRDSNVDVFPLLFPDDLSEDINDVVDRVLDYIFSNKLVNRSSIASVLDKITSGNLLSNSDLCEAVLDQCPRDMFVRLLEDMDGKYEEYAYELFSYPYVVEGLLSFLLSHQKEQKQDSVPSKPLDKVDSLRKALRS